MTVAEAHRDPPAMASVRQSAWRVVPVAIGVLLIVLILTWVTQRSQSTEAERNDRILSELDHFGLLEAALQRDALTARAGMLRSYDPLVREVSGLDTDLALLRSSVGGEAAPALGRLTASVQEQEVLIEQFKSRNALLQNSLAHFEVLSARTAQQAGDLYLMPEVRALAAAMLHLTLDTSPDTVQEVRDCLDALQRAAVHADDEGSIQSLLAHGRLLDQILPSTDAALTALRTSPETRQLEALRAILLKQERAARDSSRAGRLVLYLASLGLAGLLLRLGLELRGRVEALRRRASFEHVLATISMRFVKAPVQETAAEIRRALAQMADCVDADRAYFVCSRHGSESGARIDPEEVWCDQDVLYTWSREGVGFPRGWPAGAVELARHFCGDAGGIVHVSHVMRLPRTQDRRALAAQSLQGWACASIVSKYGGQFLLGFDAVRHPCRMSREGELSLLGVALDALQNAVRREQLDAERDRLQRSLQHAQRMETVGALASGIAHNFNNIIGAILGYAEMVELDASGEAGRARNLEEIRRAGDRARELVKQIMSFGGRREERRRPVSVADCVGEAISLLRASMPRAIELDVGPIPAAALVSAGPAQLQQVILNLCTNAAQAMGGAGRIELSAEMHELEAERTFSHGRLPPGRYVSLAVSDSGCGIDETTLARIFEPFFTTRPTGNGLGLATVLDIVSEYEGAMHVVSARGAGARFEAWLPCIGRSQAAPATGASGSFGSGETVLVIDDHRPQLLRSEEILAALGYEPVGFSVTELALDMCREAPTRFDAALVGHSHVRDGLAIAAAIHGIVPELPVVLASGAIEAAAADPLAARHGVEIVHRPLINGEVAAALSRRLSPHPGPATAPQELSESSEP